MIFTNTFDRSNKLITLFATLLMVATMFIGSTEPGTWYITVLLVLLNGSILFFTWALHPRSYSIESGRIIIERFIKRIEIPFAEVTEVKAAEPEFISGSMRVLGSGGLFGLYGKFKNRQLGNYLMYVTNRKKMVLLRCKNQLYLISPEDRDGFIAEAQKHISL
jgi:Bacterial PH domain